MPGVAEREGARAQVDSQVNGGRETFRPLLAHEVVVGRGQQPFRLHLTEQPPDRSRTQQRPGARGAALPGQVDERDLQAMTVGRQGGDGQIAGELVAVRRPDGRLGVPTGRQRRHVAQCQQPIAQVDEHVLTAVALHPEPLP